MKKTALYTLIILSLLVSFNCKAEPGPFDEVHIAFMAGGAEENFFARRIYKGALEAEQNLGCKVDYYWSNWDPDQMVLDMMEAIESEPDAICIMGHPGLSMMEPLVTQAMDKGIIVTCLNVNIPELEESLQHRGFGYVGQDVYQSGQNLVKAALSRYEILPEHTIWVFGVASVANRGKRTRGILDELSSQNLKYRYFDLFSYNDNLEELEIYLHNLLAEYGPPDYLFVDVYSQNIINVLLKSNYVDPAKLTTFSFDLSEKQIAALEVGIVDLVQDQQPYLQGYLPILQACLTVKYGFSGLHINTDSSYIDKHSLIYLEDLVRQEYR